MNQKEKRITKDHQWYLNKVKQEKAEQNVLKKNNEFKKVNEELAKF